MRQFSLQVNLWESSSEYVPMVSEPNVFMSSEGQSDALKALLNSALKKQEASLLFKISQNEADLRADFLSKVTSSEARLRAELAAKEGFGQQLNAKVAYLQVCLL